MRVFLAGEGPDDLGDWARAAPYRRSPHEGGVIEALLRREGLRFTILDARMWKHIRKYRAGNHARADTRNVLGLALHAEEAGCEVLVFARDRDGDDERAGDIEAGVVAAKDLTPALSMVGGVAVEEGEAWILALLGERRSDSHADPKSVLAERHGITTRAQKVAVVDASEPARTATDATSLHAWLTSARATFAKDA